MKNKNSENDPEDLDFLIEFDEPIFHKDIMIQKLDKKKILSIINRNNSPKKNDKRHVRPQIRKIFFQI